MTCQDLGMRAANCLEALVRCGNAAALGAKKWYLKSLNEQPGKPEKCCVRKGSFWMLLGYASLFPRRALESMGRSPGGWVGQHVVVGTC